MRILCNLPLECFDERSAMRDVELVTFGPPERMLIDRVHYRFDVAFDPSRQSWHELQAMLPAGFTPDLVLIWWPDQEPLPSDLEQCPVPVVGIVSDYNLSLPHLVGTWPFFDTLLCDRNGVDLFRRLSFADVRYWCQYAHKRPLHHLRSDAGARDIDVGFAGNMNATVQRERGRWLDRVRGLRSRNVRSAILGGVEGRGYGRFLNRCRIGFNRSIRGEMNLRGFEVPACGALLLMERENLEVREFFEPGEECVLYGEADFEDVIDELLGDPTRLTRIAAAGHHRVQQHRLGERLPQLFDLATGPIRRPESGLADRLLGRAMAMVTSWADGSAVLAAAEAAHQVAPDDPRTLNLLGIATLRAHRSEGARRAFEYWQQAAQIARDYVPAAFNLMSLAQLADQDTLAHLLGAECQRRLHAVRDWDALDGTLLPYGYTADSIDRSLALQQAVRTGTPDSFVESLRALSPTC